MPTENTPDYPRLLVPRIGDLLNCPTHGMQPIITGSPTTRCEGAPIVRVGDWAACGATITEGVDFFHDHGQKVSYVGATSDHGGEIVTGSSRWRLGVKPFDKNTEHSPHSQKLIRDYILKTYNIMNRETWGARPIDETTMDREWGYKSIVIHHAGNWSDSNQSPRDIQDEHMDTNGWSDIGYHYLIAPNGAFYEGRSLLFKGSAVKKGNTKRLNICMIGDYSTDDEGLEWYKYDFVDDPGELSEDAKNSLYKLVETLKANFPLVDLGGHKEYQLLATGEKRACPGNILMDEMDQFRADLGLAKPTVKSWVTA